MSDRDTADRNFRDIGESVWLELAQTVAEQNGVTLKKVGDQLGWIDGNGENFTGGSDDNAAVKTRTVTEFNNGDFVVRLGGTGVGGNAMANFGDTEAGEAAAKQFASLPNSLSSGGILDDVLMDGFEFAFPVDGEGAGWVQLANQVNEDGAGTADERFRASELINVDGNSINQDEARDDTNFQARANGDFAVLYGGNGVPGNATAIFGNEDDAVLFKALADLELLTDPSGTTLFSNIDVA